MRIYIYIRIYTFEYPDFQQNIDDGKKTMGKVAEENAIQLVEERFAHQWPIR